MKPRTLRNIGVIVMLLGPSPRLLSLFSINLKEETLFYIGCIIIVSGFILAVAGALWEDIMEG